MAPQDAHWRWKLWGPAHCVAGAMAGAVAGAMVGTMAGAMTGAMAGGMADAMAGAGGQRHGPCARLIRKYGSGASPPHVPHVHRHPAPRYHTRDGAPVPTLGGGPPRQAHRQHQNQPLRLESRVLYA